MYRPLMPLLLMSVSFPACIIAPTDDCGSRDHATCASFTSNSSAGAGPSVGPATPNPPHPPGTTVPDASAGGTKHADAGLPGPQPGTRLDAGPAMAQDGGAIDGGTGTDARPDLIPPCNDTGGCGKPALLLCTWNSECGSGGRCANGECQRACASTADCGSGATCQSGFCQAAPAAGGQCLLASDCAGGASCINGYCHAGCKVDSDCLNHADACTAGLCRPDARPTPQCRANKDCAQGRECVNAVCRTPCGTDDNCGALCSGTVCSVGYCMEAQELSPQCTRDGDCGAGHTCIDALCF